MADQELERHIPEHPLPKEIQNMQKDDTVCQFCGVSYLIHSEMKALEERVKEAERQMEYYRGSVEREEQLKVKVKSMEEQSDQLLRALQASEERSKVFITELGIKEKEIESLKKEKTEHEVCIKDLKDSNHILSSTIKDLKGGYPKLQTQLKTHKSDLNHMKTDMKNMVKDILGDFSERNTKLTEMCRKYAVRFEEFKNEVCQVEGNLKTSEKDKEDLQSKLQVTYKELSDMRMASGVMKELQTKCDKLDRETKEQQEELKRITLDNNNYISQLTHHKESITSKTKDTEDLQQRLLKQEESAKQEKRKLQEVILAKEKELYVLTEKNKELETKVLALSKTETETMAMASSSQQQIKAMKDLLAKARDEITSLKDEREKMITAHHNRIEQLRESFKKKMEEADAWPDKFEQAIREQQEKFKKEKDELWKELNDSFQKDLQDEQQRHADDLRQWKTEAKHAQDKFRDDLNALNRKHRDELRKTKESSSGEKDELTRLKHSSSAIISGLESKILDLESRLSQRTNTSAGEVTTLRARVQDLEQTVDEADEHIKQLEGQVDSSNEQVMFLQETVRRECEERLDLTDALSEARTQLLALQRNTSASLSRTSLNSSTSLSSTSLARANKGGLSTSDSMNDVMSSTCTVGFDGVGRSPSRGSGSRDTGRQSRSGSVNDSRQRIAAALGRNGSRSRLGGNYSS